MGLKGLGGSGLLSVGGAGSQSGRNWGRACFLIFCWVNHGFFVDVCGSELSGCKAAVDLLIGRFVAISQIKTTHGTGWYLKVSARVPGFRFGRWGLQARLLVPLVSLSQCAWVFRLTEFSQASPL
jgi:hypothetical protein